MMFVIVPNGAYNLSVVTFDKGEGHYKEIHTLLQSQILEQNRMLKDALYTDGCTSGLRLTLLSPPPSPSLSLS